MLRDRMRLHVLALDWSQVQTDGASRKDESKASRRARWKQVTNVPTANDVSRDITHRLVDEGCQQLLTEGSLTYVTADIDANTLLEATRSWVIGRLRHPTPPDSISVVPTLFIALHACGSLTLDILRAFVSAAKAEVQTTGWVPQGAVVVGCCYNMLRQEG